MGEGMGEEFAVHSLAVGGICSLQGEKEASGAAGDLGMSTHGQEQCFLCGLPLSGESAYHSFPCCAPCFAQQQRDEKATLRACNVFQEPTHIVDNIYVGGEASAINSEYLRANNFTRILVAAAYCEQRFPDEFEYMVLDVDDSPGQDLGKHFPSAIEFMTKDRKSNVLVHCVSGISRSGSVAIAYIMKDQGVPFEEAWERARAARSCIHPNSGFQKQLREYERTLQR